jgi:diguanylate cyclase (GGDEF)-like protein
VLRQSTRAEDLVARYGGEEFIASLPIISRDQAQERSERIRSAVKSLRPAVRGRSLPVTCSIGVAFGSADRPRSVEQLVLGADRALYQAKNAGRDRVALEAVMCVADTTLNEPDESGIALQGPMPIVAVGSTTVDIEVYRE